MNAEQTIYRIWVNWERYEASYEPVDGFEPVTFYTEENYRSNLRLLTRSGFRFL